MRHGLMLENNNKYFHFEDAEVERICVSNWGGDGLGIHLNEFENVNNDEVSTAFKGKNLTIGKFNEFKLFKGITWFGGYNNILSDNVFEEITLPDSITTLYKFPFYRLGYKLKRANIPNQITTLVDHVMYSVSGDAVIELGENISTMSSQAFLGGKPKLFDVTNCPNLVNYNGCMYTSDFKTLWCVYFTTTEFDLHPLCTGIEAGACNGNNLITDINVPDEITWVYYPNNVGYVFSDMSNLKTVRWSSNAPNIPVGCFSDDTKLEEINNIENVEKICGKAFNNCSSLKHITMGENVILHFSNAPFTSSTFSNCTSLKWVKCLATTPPAANTGFFDDSAVTNGTCYIYVPKDAITAYKKATAWTAYATQIMPMSYYDTFGIAPYTGTSTAESTLQLTALRQGENPEVTWEIISGDATIDETGLLTFNTEGEVTVKATLVEDTSISLESTYTYSTVSTLALDDEFVPVYIKASEGKVFKRKSDGLICGNELWLGYAYYTFDEEGNAHKLEEPYIEQPSDYEEIDEPICEDESCNIE